MGFWQRLGEAVLAHTPAARPATRPTRLPASDAADTAPPDETSEPAWEVAPIAGLQLEIDYRDSKGQSSSRRITCRRVEMQGGQAYIFALCLERHALRRFRVDRIIAVVDPATGEVHEPARTWLEQFLPAPGAAPRINFGLGVKHHADLIAGLNVLAFMARCDGQWHDLEAAALEAFAASWWTRAEITAPFASSEVLDRAARIGPDAETFYLSLRRCVEDPLLRQIVGTHVAAVIDADGHHHPRELFWGREVVEALERGG